jgi:hypothetical protein
MLTHMKETENNNCKNLLLETNKQTNADAQGGEFSGRLDTRLKPCST